jgi:hypothetical protein
VQASWPFLPTPLKDPLSRAPPHPRPSAGDRSKGRGACGVALLQWDISDELTNLLHQNRTSLATRSQFVLPNFDRRLTAYRQTSRHQALIVQSVGKFQIPNPVAWFAMSSKAANGQDARLKRGLVDLPSPYLMHLMSDTRRPLAFLAVSALFVPSCPFDLLLLL